MSQAAKPSKDGITLSVHVTPSASSCRWSGLVDRSVKITVQAKPVEDKANQAVCEFVAVALAVPKSSVTILLGRTNRRKLLAIRGDTAILLAKVAALCERP